MTKLGVVFSSGFFGFFAHAGFLAALRDREMISSGYAGASSGAIVAAMAASGMSDLKIKEMLLQVRKKDFWDPDPWNIIIRKALTFFRGYTGYLRGRGFNQLLNRLPVDRIEDCDYPLAITATNLTQKKETIFTRGGLGKAIRASGAVPMLFKPVELDGLMYVDGGMVNKAPVLAMADLIKPKRIIVHLILSDNLEDRGNGFLKKRMAPWHIHHLSINIARQEAYQRQCEIAGQRGIEVVEVKTNAPSVDPNNLHRGPLAYKRAREETVNILSKKNM